MLKTQRKGDIKSLMLSTSSFSLKDSLNDENSLLILITLIIDIIDFRYINKL